VLKLLINLGSNLAAILAAEYFVAGFHVSHEPVGLAIVVILFTIVNSLILPIIRFILKPLIWLTLGLLALVINGALIYFVDKLSDSITIEGLVPLMLATVIIGMVNATVAYGAKVFKHHE
jgi:putative membrane protein